MQDVLKESEAKMHKAVEVVKRNFAAVRTGRASPALLDHVMVNYYGAPAPLKQLASVAVPEPRMMVITPYDKNALQEIEKAIQTSDLGINPSREANLIRLVLPEPSEERRKELVKLTKKEAEEGKVAIRNVRREGNEALKKKKKAREITEDDERIQDKKVQDLTDKFCKEIDQLLTAKDKEIMEV